jgi:hypothetical protein
VVLNSIAWHEAGHAVIAWAQGLPVQKVTIAPDAIVPRHAPMLGALGYGPGATMLSADADLGDLKYSPKANTRRRVEAFARALLAGDLSRRHAGIDPIQTARAEADRGEACELLALVCESEDEIEEHVRLLEIQTAKLVALHWDLIGAVSRALLERSELDAEQMRRILRGSNAGRLG